MGYGRGPRSSNILVRAGRRAGTGCDSAARILQPSVRETGKERTQARNKRWLERAQALRKARPEIPLTGVA